MNCIYFISDLHQSQRPQDSGEVWDFFERVRKEEGGRAEGIFILGDFFEFWWGDDHSCDAYTEWELYFREYPVPLYFLPGNRDFFCGAEFYKRTGITPLRSGDCLQYGGHTIGIFHGDEPGLKDSPYQIFRYVSRGFLGQLFLTLPEFLRRNLCLKLRKMRSFTEPIDRPIAFSQWLAQCNSSPNVIVHGHLHIPIAEYVDMDEDLGHSCFRYQLGSWDRGAYSYLQLYQNGLWNFKCDPSNLELTIKIRGLEGLLHIDYDPI